MSVVKVHENLLVKSEAVFSDCGTYRYVLRRSWDEWAGKINFLMLNPSTADELQNDPTIDRCEKRARLGGFGGYVITNLFAYRSTDPKAMIRAGKAGTDVVGPENDYFLLREAYWGRPVICAWGKDGSFQGRSDAVRLMLQKFDLFALRVSEKTGQPWHPLYLPFDLSAVMWQPSRELEVQSGS